MLCQSGTERYEITTDSEGTNFITQRIQNPIKYNCNKIKMKFNQGLWKMSHESRHAAELGFCPIFSNFSVNNLREKGRDLNQSHDKSPYTHKKSKKQRDNTKTPPKTSITQRLRTDLGRRIWLKWFLHREVEDIQWRSSAPKSGGGGAQTEKQKKKKKKKEEEGHSGVKEQGDLLKIIGNIWDYA